MTIRTEIETRLATFAAAQAPPIPVAYENQKFIKPATGSYLEIFFLDTTDRNRNLSAEIRTFGKFQISCYGQIGTGMKDLEELVQQVKNLYPVLPKTGTVSIEQPLSSSQSLVVDNFVCVPVTGSYRVEQ